MKRVMAHCSLTFLLLLVWTGTGLAAPEKMGLVTGGEKGTYYQFGLDLQKPRGRSRTSTPSTSGRACSLASCSPTSSPSSPGCSRIKP